MSEVTTETKVKETSDMEVHDLTNLICPKPLIQTKAMINNSTTGGPIKVIVPADSGLRLKEMVKKQKWHVLEEHKEGFRHTIIIQKD